MKHYSAKRSLLLAVFAIMACVSVQARAIIPFGKIDQQPWTAQFFYATIASGETPGDNWMAADFNDYDWGTITGPIVSGTLSYKNTTWETPNTTYWVRCHFTPTAEDLTKFLYLFIANDYTCEAYINGVQVYNVTSAANHNIIALSDEAKTTLQAGEDNVLAVRVSDTNGGDRYMDFGLYASDFIDAVTRHDVPLVFENDPNNPFSVEGYNIVRRGVQTDESWLKMNYTSAYRTELSFDWRYDYQGASELYIDGVFVEQCGTGHTYYYFGSRRFIIEPGEHVIAFHDMSANHINKVFEIKNLQLKEMSPIEASSAMSANSQPLTFTNNSAIPWTIEDGYIEFKTMGLTTSSSISTTFTVTETSKLSFDYAFNPDRYIGSNSGYSSGYHALNVSLNGALINSFHGNETYNTFNATFEPGTYTVELTDTAWRGEQYYVHVKNIELSNNWVNVELASPGTLGYEVLYSPGINVLDDVEFLKVKGTMNDADWGDIKNMQNLKALDLSEAVVTTIPDYAFDGMNVLGSVILPETATSIGEYAFRNTTIRRINIPANITEIKQYAFQSTPVMYVTFSEGSQLKTIGNYAFNSCNLLQEIELPALLERIGYESFSYCETMKRVTMGDAVTFIDLYAFRNNYMVESMRFSDGLNEIYPYMCAENHELKEVHLPSNVKIINQQAFINAKKLATIKFPASLEKIMFEAFRYTALDSVKLPVNMQWLGTNAFSNITNLKYIEFPSFIESGDYAYLAYRYSYWGYHYSDGSGYRSNFQSCPNIEKIVMRSATPPTVPADPFASGRDKSVITLVVPSFAVVNYKLDTYWKQFGNIIEGDDIDYWKITSPLMLTNNRRMQGTPDVDLYYNGQLTVGGAAPMPMANFNMYFSEENPGRLLNTSDGISAEHAATKFSVAANKWYFFTPVHDVTVADITVTNSASYVIRYYDAENRAVNGATGSWKNVDAETLTAGQGYIFHCNAACEITFPVADNAGQQQLFRTTDVTRNLSVNESEVAANRSWNYIGNPYPAYYDIYYLDFTAPITVWTGSTYKAYSTVDDDYVLRPMQSFFVQKPDAVDHIVFRKEGRQLLSTVAAHPSAARQAAPAAQKRRIFTLQMAAQGAEAAADETRIVLNEGAEMGYELERDASKFMSFEAAVPQLFTTDQEGNRYAINERPQQDGQVALSYYTGQEGSYTIHALRNDDAILLTDNEENTTVDLTQQDYTFYSNTAGNVNASRFVLTLGQDSEATGINAVNRGDAAKSVIYDLQGRQVKTPRKGIYVRNGQKVVLP